MNRLTKKELSTIIREKALEIGFFKCGVSPAISYTKEGEYLKKWLQDGKHGNMKYLENHFDKRINPALLADGAKSVISVLLNYYPEQIQPVNCSYKVSKYAYGKDYHKILRKKLKILAGEIVQLAPGTKYRVFVDSAPLLERKIASMAGLGWIGKNTMLINPDQGSFFFIGEILCDLELEYDSELSDLCGRCVACLKSCPTNALNPERPYQMDASLCISYQTIEDQEKVVPLRKNKQWIFGCDICQEVCPWNRKSSTSKEAGFKIIDFIKNSTSEDWENLTESQYKESFTGSPLKRAKFNGLKENIRIVKANIQATQK